MLRTAVLAAAFALATAASPDMPFLAKAAEGDLAEVKASQLAQNRAASPAVKEYAAMMIADHGNHRPQVAALAKAKGVTVPQDVSPEHKAVHDRLAALNGAAFDRAFKAAMVADHQKTIALYREGAKDSDAEVAALARQTLPVLEQHLAAARQL